MFIDTNIRDSTTECNFATKAEVLACTLSLCAQAGDHVSDSTSWSYDMSAVVIGGINSWTSQSSGNGL
jgi:uncharacterized membrane-anchored protein